MRPTLFYVPHEFFGVPVFGMGWALGLLILIAVLTLATSLSKQPITKVLEEQGVMWGVLALIILFLLPQIETRIDDGTPSGWVVGLPVRGYGVMLMLAVLSAVAIAMHLCKKAGMSQEMFFSLATWEIVIGLLGARIFYVVQKWTVLDGDTVVDKLWTALKVTEGGLVVYGGAIGGLVAMLMWCRWHRHPIMPIADAITPAFLIGLAFGRLGCLLNGCCYGGICETGSFAIEFPAGSPAYVDQLRTGKLIGISTEGEASESKPQRIQKVAPKSWAAENKLHEGQTLNSIKEYSISGPSPNAPLALPVFEAAVRVDNRQLLVESENIPHNSLPVHPSQIYAAISGMLLCAWTFLLAEIVKKYGIVFGAGLVAYGVSRILEEIIRVDESGQFGTSLSIAQWISLVGIVFGVAMVVLSNRYPFYKPSDLRPA